MRNRIIICEDTIKIRKYFVPYQVIRNLRAKKIHLKFKENKRFEIIIPFHFPYKEILLLLPKCHKWMEKMWEDRYKHERCLDLPDIRPGGWVLFMGNRLYLYSKKTDKPAVNFTHINESLYISLPRNEHYLFQELVISWLKNQARDIVSLRTREIASKIGVAPKKIRIKTQKTRWGSCSKKKNLNLNWRLILTPPAVTDYVIIHELCHLIELNHSERFWQTVKKYCPHYKKSILWLKEFDSYVRFDNLKNTFQEN